MQVNYMMSFNRMSASDMFQRREPKIDKIHAVINSFIPSMTFEMFNLLYGPESPIPIHAWERYSDTLIRAAQDAVS